MKHHSDISSAVAGGSLSQNSLPAPILLRIGAAGITNYTRALDRFKLLIARPTLITAQTSVLVSKSNGFQLVSPVKFFLLENQQRVAFGFYDTPVRLANR